MIFFELFYTFFYIGLFTFGGGYAMIPMIQDSVVSKNWLSINELTDFIAISEGTPGPFAINISTFIGSKVGGSFGAICSTVGVILPSFIIIILLALVMRKIMSNRFVQSGLKGASSVVLALVLSTAIIFLIRLVLFNGESINSSSFSFDRTSFSILIILFLFAYIYKKRRNKNISPLLILLIGAVLGIIFFGLNKI